MSTAFTKGKNYITLDTKVQQGSNGSLSDLIKKHKRVIVKFTADWCGPCKVIESKIVEFSKLYPKVTIIEVDIDSDAGEIAKDEYKIKAVPSFLSYYRSTAFTSRVESSNLTNIEKVFKDLTNYKDENSTGAKSKAKASTNH